MHESLHVIEFMEHFSSLSHFLFLNSDIDVTILHAPLGNRLYDLANALEESNIAASMNVIPKARVGCFLYPFE